MAMRQKLEQAIDWRNVGLTNISAVVDTSYWVDRATNKLWTLPVAYFLQDKTVITMGPVEKEYEYHRKTGALDSERVPKAPVPLEILTSLIAVAYAETGKVGLPENIEASEKMDYPDKENIRGAVYFAHETGQGIYVVTNDTAIISSIKRELNTEGVYPLMPSTVEEHLSGLLRELGLQMLIRGKVLAGLYELGKAGIQQGIMPYVVVERNQCYRFGKDALTIDIATELAFAEIGKRIPSTTKTYGVPIAIITSDGQTVIDDAFDSLKPHLHGKKKLWCGLYKPYSFMPFIFRATTNPDVVQTYLNTLDDEVSKIKETAHIPRRWIEKNRRKLKKSITDSNTIRWARI